MVFFLHGNGGNLVEWFVNVNFDRRLNLDLYMIDYRGDGKSSSRISSQAQLMADVRTAWLGITPRDAGQRRVFSAVHSAAAWPRCWQRKCSLS